MAHFALAIQCKENVHDFDAFDVLDRQSWGKCSLFSLPPMYPEKRSVLCAKFGGDVPQTYESRRP